MSAGASSFTYRLATPDDAGAIAALHVAGWQGAYGGMVNQAYLDELSVEQRQRSWADWLQNPALRVLLAFDGDTAAGFCSFGKILTPPPGQSNIRPAYTCEIMALYLLPAYYRHGIGRQMMQTAAQTLLAEKHAGLALWVLAANKRACAFYEALGGQRIGSKMQAIGPDTLKEVCYGWRDLRKLLPKPLIS